jgi:uncharacterized membrane protein YdbT with pleckstrin-like domain
MESFSAPQGEYYTLGRKTFWLFLLQNTFFGFVILLFSLFLFFFRSYTDQGFAMIVTIGSFIAMTIGVLCLAIGFCVAWLVYTHYRYGIHEDALRIRRGVLTKREIAIPYRQIQNVNIEQNLVDQVMGTCRLVILTAAHDEPEEEADDTEGVLPLLDVTAARGLQRELLARAKPDDRLE